MPPSLRGIVSGALAGLASALLLLLVRLDPGGSETSLLDFEASVADIPLQILLGTLLGAVLGHIAPDRARNHAATLATGLVLGLLWWLVGAMTIAPLVLGDGPTWAIDAASGAIPSLIGDLVWGGLAGFLLALVTRVRGIPADSALSAGPPAPSLRVVILGGGFGGVAAAQRLEKLFARDTALEITLVSESNYLLFTPMLAEVASSALEAQHISAPVRASCTRTRFRRAGVSEIDLGAKRVKIRAGAARDDEELPYDHLVLSLGSVPNYRGLPGLEENSFALKSLHDATRLRNHVIGLLELADAEDDAEERRRMLTFVVVGGGFAGTEMVAELLDLVRVVLRYYPHIPEDEPSFALVHSGDRILSELGPGLGDYALRKLRSRGIEFVLETRVEGATSGEIVLSGGRSIPTRTIVWTAGNQPSPLLARLPCERTGTGSVVCESTLRVAGHEAVWAVGDCASIPDPESDGGTYPPTAQHALREGKVVAENIAAVLRGKAPKPFRFRTIGMLVALGHRTAVAEIRGRQFSGLLAWLMWRGVYWSKLPGLEKKLRVLFDWLLDLAFPRDIVVTTPDRTRTLAELLDARGDDGGDRAS